MSLQKLEMTAPIGSLEAYIHWANQIPSLSAEQENSLAKSFLHENNLEAAKQLVLSHLRFVIRIAKGYSGYGLALGDLIQEGNIGLMKAVKRFNPELGVRLVSFAVHWIKAEIHEFILRNWKIVKIATTKAQRKLFFNLRKVTQNITKKLGWFSNEEVEKVAAQLSVNPIEVRNMEARLNQQDEAFEAISYNENEEWHAPANYLEDHRYDPARLLEANNWSEDCENKLHTALASLDDRSRDILNQRWLNEQKSTLHDLADKYQVSAERIRQLEKNAMNKLKEALQDSYE